MLRKVHVLTKELQDTYSLQTGSDSCSKSDQKLMKVGLFFLEKNMYKINLLLWCSDKA